jgi:hypothetical protein
MKRPTVTSSTVARSGRWVSPARCKCGFAYQLLSSSVPCAEAWDALSARLELLSIFVVPPQTAADALARRAHGERAPAKLRLANA